MVDITESRKITEEVYSQLNQIAEEIVNKQSGYLDEAVKKLHNVDTMSNTEIRNIMAIVTVEAFRISAYKEQSELKDSCASALYKEGIAVSFNTIVGTVEARKNQSLEDNIDKQLVSILYSNVASRFKTKVDEAHRVASVLSNILISRQAEAKLSYSPRSEETLDNGQEVF